MLRNVFLLTIALLASAAAEPVARWSVGAEDQTARFDGKGGRVRIPDSDLLRFGKGDAITLEAMVQLDGKADTPYIIGKGRLSKDAENQNWALRLMKVGGRYRVSFLFRSQADETEPEAFHRWNSNFGIVPGKLWHHVAVRYRFGEPASVRGFVNGTPSAGKWDLGGETTRPPVADASEVWIGSSRGGDPGNSWNGALDEVAVHRELVSDEVLAARVDFGEGVTEIDWNAVGQESVSIDVFNDLAEGHAWPQRMVDEPESLTTSALALLDMPPRYVEGGSRERRRATLIRMATRMVLGDEPQEFLLRAPSLARLSIDGDVIAQLGAYQIASDGHQLMRPAAEEASYPRARLGSRDTIVSLPSSPGEHKIVLEGVVGRESIRFTLGEMIVASRKVGETAWHLVTPSRGDPQAFTPVGMARYREHQAASFVTLADERRLQTRRDWTQRHAEANAYVQTLPPIEVPKGAATIDHFLATKIHEKKLTSAHGGLAVLQEHCVRCHGKKSKGDLKLNTREAALAGGESEMAGIVPGDPHKSAIMRRILSEDAEERMPPKGERLTDADVALLEQWITNGAPWATSAETVQVPPRLNAAAFLRRLYLDTIGIFPTAEEIHAFQADASE
ncbi:MAG: c-type cytochrome domain-containing protein, partial [Verrucomicrobiales bacterium]